MPGALCCSYAFWPSYSLIAANFTTCYKYELFATTFNLGLGMKMLPCSSVKLLYIMHVTTVDTTIFGRFDLSSVFYGCRKERRGSKAPCSYCL
ncbi:uncharacterized protein P174DRAFT_292260 [Aspergillus novofumigatus IBT 16806]|uniref:Uncharacterized protein n=1 Tax=Aspergillus novofumigatus (strain IBT 16806) TaxID=1392255 RepID=A0A2I1BY16_ASPN1|nr:uncharacterized protein P174DRAFT_292260 [Aspergillus novofumigatus IBT 16806]PKX90263.1 hypothetical protein P174DRAFT_292260 [Aspergillus novofumigatus IBT 16806]